MAFRVASVQFAPTKGRIDRNLDRVIEAAVGARDAGADLVVFPETIASGYFLEGGVLEAARTADEIRRELEDRYEGGVLDVCLGFYERSEDGILYNSAGYFELGPEGARTVATYRKIFLPTYGVFDEERFVTGGQELGVFATRFGKVGILICEDVWHGVTPMLTALAGAQLLLVPAASPARGFGPGGVENHDRYRRLFRAIAEEHGMWCVSSQLVGFEGGKGFVGGSMIVDPFGRVRVEAPVGTDAVVMGEVDFHEVAVARAASPLLSDLRSTWPLLKGLVEGVR